MDKIKLNILGLSVSQSQSGAYALVLAEESGERRIPIIIGPIEAQSIAIQLEGLKPPRPLTHDLFKYMASSFDILILEVIIYKLEEGIFYSELVCENFSNKVKIDSRTSDAVALAIRFKCPIYANESVLQMAGISSSDFGKTMNESEQDSEVEEDIRLEEKSVQELEKMLNDAINSENYELASQIRDEINKRK